jgi:acyl carrier protein
MTHTQVALHVREVLSDELGLHEDQITPEAALCDDLGADSLDITEIAMALEEEFGIEFDEVDMERCVTVHACVTLVEQKLAARAAVGK